MGHRPSLLGKFNAQMGGEGEQFNGIRCARVSGFSVHAGVGIRAADRKGLERLCRYGSRPPVAADRLARLPDGRLSYRLKTPWSNGATHVLFEPLELVERLAVLVPAPRLNLIRFHGVLAPAAKCRPSIVKASISRLDADASCDCETESKPDAARPNYSWATLMARVFEIDVLECPHCKGRLRILAAIHPPDNTRKILDCLDLPTRAPPTTAADFEYFNESC